MTKKKHTPDSETLKRGQHVLRARAEITRALDDGNRSHVFTAKLRDPTITRSRVDRILSEEGLEAIQAIEIPENVKRAVALLLDAIEDAVVHGDGADALVAAEELDKRRLRGFVEECRRQIEQSPNDAILMLPSYFARFFPDAPGLTEDDARWAITADKSVDIIAAGLLVRGGAEERRPDETLNAAARRVLKDKIKKLGSKGELLRIVAAYQKE